MTASVLSVFHSAGPPVADLAFEADMMARAARGEALLLLTSWPGTTVVLGYGQDPADADLVWCRAHGVPVLRRLSGGTGVIHQHDLGVGLALPAAHRWARDVHRLYGHFLDVLEPALAALGGGDVRRPATTRRASRVRSPVCFEDQLADTLVRGGRKVVGCAQTRRRGAVLIHAAILLGLEPALYEAVFRVPEERIAAALGAALDGCEPAALGREIAARLGRTLECEPLEGHRPEPSAAALSVYDDPRWAPDSVADSRL